MTQTMVNNQVNPLTNICMLGKNIKQIMVCPIAYGTPSHNTQGNPLKLPNFAEDHMPTNVETSWFIDNRHVHNV